MIRHGWLPVEFYDRQDRNILGRPSLGSALLADGTVRRCAAQTRRCEVPQHGYARGIEVYVQRRRDGFTGGDLPMPMPRAGGDRRLCWA